MELTSQTSFIPKKPLGSSPRKSSSGVNIITLVAVILFLGSVTLAVGVFLYQEYLTTNLSSMKQSFTLNEQAFDPASITNLTTLSQRLTVAQELLKNHIAPSVLLSVLEASTLKNVRFTSFTFTFTSPQQITLAMNGQATDYNSIAEQSNVFSESPANQYIHNPIFSNLNLDSSGDVTFNFNADVDPGALLYSNYLSESSSSTNSTN